MLTRLLYQVTLRGILRAQSATGEETDSVVKIAVFTDSCLPYCSGVTYAALAQTTELCKRGHQVVVFRPKPGKQFRDERVDLPENATMLDIPLTLPAPRLPELRLVIPTVWSTYRYLRRNRPDVVHVQTEWGCGWEGLLAAKLLKIPVVGTFHTFFADPGYLKSLRLPTWRWIQSAVWNYAVTFFNCCDVVTSPSQAVRDSLVRNGLNKYPLVLSNGISVPEPPAQEEVASIRRAHGITGPSFVYVGRIAPEKSLDVLIRAFANVHKRLPDAKLVVIGDGPTSEQMDALVTELQLDEAILRLGFVPHDELLQGNLLLLGDAMVTASKTENQPLSVLEAMAYSRPVIGPHAKGLREMIDDGVNGFAFQPDDVDGMAQCMIQLAEMTNSNSDSYREMGQAARGYVADHSLDASIDQLEGIYRQLCGETTMEKQWADQRSLTAA